MEIPVSFRRFRGCIQLSVRENAIDKPKLEATTLNLGVAIRAADRGPRVECEYWFKLASIGPIAHPILVPAHGRCDKLEGRKYYAFLLERMEK
jgi:hypothetical protein